MLGLSLRVAVTLALSLCYLTSAQEDFAGFTTTVFDDGELNDPASELQDVLVLVDLSQETHEDIALTPLLESGLSRNTWYLTMDDGLNSTFKTENLCLPSHYGTHLDAPCHYCGSLCLTDLPLESIVSVPAAVIDIRSKVFLNDTINVDAELTVEDILNWEEIHGPIPEKSVVLMLSGWDKYWDNHSMYLGGTTKETLHYPGISADAADWVMQNRPTVYGMGVDTISADYGPSRFFEAHRMITRANKYILENLANLEQIPPTGALVHIGVVKIGKEASGAPARVTATYTTRRPVPSK